MHTRVPWFVLARHDEDIQPTIVEPAKVEPVKVVEPAKVDTKTDGPNGFPESTPLTEMTPDQRESYWKFQSRKHEQAYKNLGIKDAAELDGLREAAKKLADLEESQKSDTEKAISEAEKRGRAETVTEYAERLAKAEFRAAAAGKIPNADELVDDLNLAKFVTNGEVDSAAIAAAVERLAKAVPPAPKPPAADLMQGARPGSPLDFRSASKEELDAELAKHGARRRS